MSIESNSLAKSPRVVIILLGVLALSAKWHRAVRCANRYAAWRTPGFQVQVIIHLPSTAAGNGRLTR
jgi:hypothetical protein